MVAKSNAKRAATQCGGTTAQVAGTVDLVDKPRSGAEKLNTIIGDVGEVEVYPVNPRLHPPDVREKRLMILDDPAHEIRCAAVNGAVERPPEAVL